MMFIPSGSIDGVVTRTLTSGESDVSAARSVSFSLSLRIHIYIYIYVCVYVCVSE